MSNTNNKQLCKEFKYNILGSITYLCQNVIMEKDNHNGNCENARRDNGVGKNSS